MCVGGGTVWARRCPGQLIADSSLIHHNVAWRILSCVLDRIEQKVARCCFNCYSAEGQHKFLISLLFSLVEVVAGIDLRGTGHIGLVFRVHHPAGNGVS